ncbi:hypothetical protein Pint_15120 [Pistacia integerrima]|uniref:Uncharacterized protein n=1 Tax=Pistacia integerrima TaxID=434235 RepID=A0ACC0ZF61_9ROSI|nr:hypothetical protein Pint_15120 [Pistacia integerrima]
MLGTISLEVASFINSDLTWKGSKGKRSSLRRAKRSVSRSLKRCGELVNQYSKTADMPVSESEKLGVSILGCRFSEKAEHVPIKKRRFVYRSPSPPPRAMSSQSEETEMKRPSKLELGVIDCSASANDLGQIVDNVCDADETNMERVKGRVDENEDFSGISILAAAACSKGFGGEDGHTEDGSGVEESFVRDVPLEGLTNNESCSLSKEVSKDDLSSAENSTKGSGSCISALPAEEPAACLRKGNSSESELSHRNNMEDTSVQDHLTSKDVSIHKVEETVQKQGFSSRDDRLHWDLNTSMDSWEHPFDYQVVDSKIDAADGVAEDADYGNHSDKMINSEGHGLQIDSGDSKADAEKEMPPSDATEMFHTSNQSNVEECKSKVCADSGGADYLEENVLSSEFEDAVRVDQSKGSLELQSQERLSIDAGPGDFVPADDVKRLSASINKDKNIADHSASFGCTGSNEGLSSHGVGNLGSCADNNLPSKPTCNASSSAADAGALNSSDSQVEKLEVAPFIALSGNSINEIGDVLDKVADETKEISASLDDTDVPMDIDPVETGQPPKIESLGGVLETFACSSPLGIDTPTLGASIEAQPTLSVDLKVQHANVSVLENAETNTLLNNDGEEPEKKCIEKSTEMLQPPSVHSSHDVLSRSNNDDLVNSSDRMALDEPLDNGYCSDVSRDHAHVKSSEILDYDSQYEDGEVRESIVHTWEDYDGEEMEAEHVDYGSDNANTLGCEAEKTVKHTQETDFQPCLSGLSGSGKERPLKGKDGKVEVELGDEAGADKVIGDGFVSKVDDTNNQCLSADSAEKTSRWDRKNLSDALTAEIDGSSRKNITDDCIDVQDTDGTKVRVFRPTEFRRELPSHIEGRVSHDAYFEDDKPYMQGSSDADNINPRSERDPGYRESLGRGRYNQHVHARGQGSDHWVHSAESHRGLKRYQSPNYLGPTSFRRPGPENGSFGRQKIDASSLSVHRRLTRSGSPVDRDEAFHLRLGFRPSRELSPGRRVTLGRGRSLRYGPRVDGRGLRGRYHGPMPDDCSEPSLNHSHPSAKRERSFSPNERRGEDRARKSLSKSPSRSRTRFPDSGNPNLKHRSKSPNFRSEVRMPRGKSPHQRPGFLGDRVVGFRTMHRSHGSPPHNSRWIGDWKDGVVHLREQGLNQRSSVLDRRSPGRFGPRDDRFDVDSPRNYRYVHPGRFTEMDGVGRGRVRYEGSDDNREKHSYRFGPFPPAKRYGMDGVVKPFRYNLDDGFVKARNSRHGEAADFHGRGNPREFSRGIESRIGEGPRRFREERGPFTYQRDGKYNVNPKSFAIRENDDDIASRRRPS